MRPRILYIVFLWGMAFHSVQAQVTLEGNIYVSADGIFSTQEDLDIKPGGELYNDGRVYLYHHFVNSGATDFLEAGGTTYFSGNTAQKIAGDQSSYFYNVVFDNSGLPIPFEVSNKLHIEGTAYFKNGVVNNRDFDGLLVFEENASEQLADDQSHANGAIWKKDNHGFFFPLGSDQNYRLTGVMTSSGGTPLEAQYFLDNSNYQYPHSSKPEEIEFIDNREYWKIDRPQEMGEVEFLVLSWHEDTSPPEIVEAAEAGKLAILRWEESSQTWINEGGSASVSDQTITGSISGFGIFTLGVTRASDYTCKVEVYNFVDLSGVSNNDYLRIRPQEDCDIDIVEVKVFNRWGAKVFETKHYGVEADVFDGYSTGQLTINKKEPLPAGTYFYVVDYEFFNAEGNLKNKQEVGYLYLN